MADENGARMVDIKVNFLPWREADREAKNKAFLKSLAVAMVFAVLIIVSLDRFYNAEIDSQLARNEFLSREISNLAARVEELKLLQENHNELISRMTVIRNLQGNRPIMVRLFDELARQLAPGIFYSSLRLRGTVLAITGVAESNTQISTQLRRYTDSVWFNKPNVTEIQADKSHGPQASRFALSVEQSTPRVIREHHDPG